MQIPKAFRSCVSYVYYKNSRSEFKVAGTSFFVAIVQDNPDDPPFVYAVTAHHVIAKIHRLSRDGMVHLRMNRHDGTSTMAAAPVDKWIRHPDVHVDAAVLPIAPSIERIDYTAIPISRALTAEEIETYSVEPGDDVFVTGLFRHHYGKERNIPVVRIGAIAQMREEDIDDESPYAPVDGYLIEARSTSGLSGSPVFLHVAYPRWIDGKLTQAFGSIDEGETNPVFWMGLIHAHYDDQLDGAEGINTGVAIVVPADRIVEILETPEAVNRRVP